MGHFVFRLSDIGEGITEAEITAWHVAVGDKVEQDQPLVDVMTDKATVELSSPVAGIVRVRHGSVGGMAQVGSPLLELDIAGEGAAASQQGAGLTEAVAVQTCPNTARQDGVHTPAPLASPATRHRARELGVALEAVRGTGPGGRITAPDVEEYARAMRSAASVSASASASAGAGEAQDRVRDVPIIGLRRKTAEHMQEAARRIPQFSYVEECDLTELEALRSELNREGGDRPRLTLLPFLIQALVRTLPDYPDINARYDDEANVLHVHESVHVGIATQTRTGLLVPVIRNAQKFDLYGCADELARVTAAARNNRAMPQELSGSTITLTSLGRLGGIAATPLVNQPEVAIIAPNRLVQRPAVVGGAICVRTMMNLSSSFDHRIIDGHAAASFIQAVRRRLEKPALLFIGGRAG